MNIKIKNSKENHIIIDVEGVIGEDEDIQFAGSNDVEKVSTFEKFRSVVEQINREELESLRVNIRSAGGSLQDALLIYSLLQELSQDCEIETHCYGFSASAATIIAQAATPGKRYVASSALYMIHNSSTQFDGNALEAESVADMLSKTDAQIAELYSQRSGNDAEYFLEIMARDGGRGEWLTAQEAVDAGLADEVENHLSVKTVMNSIKGLFAKVFRGANRELKELEIESDNQIENSAENRVESEIENSVDIASQLIESAEVEPLEDGEQLFEGDQDFLLMDVVKTETLSKEDPEIESLAINLTQNQSSYNSDIALFQDR